MHAGSGSLDAESVQVVEVAIVGGGCAAMAAAFELSDPKHQGKYHVTVYQQGWRLGGKGASGRGVNQRIEEHGLHLWMGFYENAFRIMRECYTELGRDPRKCPISQWHDAFVPDPCIAVTDDYGDLDNWSHWVARFPPLPGLPGDPLENHNPYTVTAYTQRCIWLVRVLLESLDESEVCSKHDATPVSDIVDLVSRFSKIGQLATLTAISEACRLLETAFASVSVIPAESLQQLLQSFQQNIRTYIGNLTEKDPATRRLWEIIDIVLAAVRGCLRYGLLTHPRGFDAINDYDWREWLRDNGASETALKSAFLRASYDLLFAYENGDVSKPRLAAGQALRGAFRMFFSYRGAVFYKMQAGMGDIVFAPFYEVLKARGVTFNFFHRLRKASLATPTDSDPHPHIATLRFDVQAKTLNNKDYDPLIDVHGLPCWTSTPDFSQLQAGDKLQAEKADFESHWDNTRATTKTLRVGKHFDLVVLAVGYGELPFVASDIIDSDARWRTMLDQIKSVETQAFQIWLNEDLSGLGWNKPSVNLSGFVEPFDTWADMTHLIQVEDWQVPLKSIAYFCSVLPESDLAKDEQYPIAREAQVRQAAIDFLNNDIRHLWPNAVTPGEDRRFRWSTLVGPTTTSDGEKQIDDQYYRANTNPTERYVLSLPGTLKYSISPLDNTYDNFSVAGDWTACGHQAGCVEAAVMSGLLAAHSICGSPLLHDIVGYDHP